MSDPSTGPTADAGAGRIPPPAGPSPKPTTERPTTEQAPEAAQDTRAGGASLVSQVQEQALSAAAAGKDEIADRVDGLAGAVQRSGEGLEGQQDWLAHLIERGADELADLASTLRTNDLNGLLSKFEDLARRQPVVFVGAAMAAGFAAVRLGKAASATTPAGAPAEARSGGTGPGRMKTNGTRPDEPTAFDGTGSDRMGIAP